MGELDKAQIKRNNMGQYLQTKEKTMDFSTRIMVWTVKTLDCRLISLDSEEIRGENHGLRQIKKQTNDILMMDRSNVSIDFFDIFV